MLSSNKIKLFFTTSILVFSSFAVAQSFSIGLSYGLAMADPTSIIGTNDSSVYVNSYSAVNSSVVKGSYGKGQYAYLFVEYNFKKNVSVDLKFGYHKGLSYFTSSYQYNDSHSGGNGNATENQEYHSFSNISQYQINPALKFLYVGAAVDSKIKPYLKVGAIFGVGNKMTEHITSKTNYSSYTTSGPNPDVTSSSEITKQFYKGISVGYTGGIGIEYKITSKFTFLTELSYVGMNWAPKYSKYTQYNYSLNGQNILTITPGETQYVNNISQNSSGNLQLKSYKPYNNINIQIELRFTFGDRSKNAPITN